MEKIWNIEEERRNRQSIMEEILLSKGIIDAKEMKEFLSKNPKKTYDPFLIKNMNEAIEHIMDHIGKRNKIIIYGDYDVDGVTSTALLVEFFSNITDNIDYYVPNRFSEGYGLNKEAVLYIREEMKGDLIITVDTGVSSFEEIEYAKELGLDVIVTDHHQPPEKLPNCILINVKQKEDKYPFKELCGCGVAFKLAQGLQRQLDLPKGILNSSLDLVALGTIADLVPLLDENRTMVKYGLKSINNNRRIGLRVLREAVGLKDQEISAGRIGYTIAPCFNAAGRLEDATLGVELLLEKDKIKAEKMAQTLVNLNKHRQEIQSEGERVCSELVYEKHLEDDFLVLKIDDVSEGVIGIIAGKMKEDFYKPTLVVTRSQEGYLKGSGRSIKGINIYDEMKKVEDLLISFGGHEMACGFSLEEDKLDELRIRLNKQANEIKQKDASVFIPKIDITAEMDAQELTIETIDEISALEPYGMGNPKPVFIIKDIMVNSNWTKICGKDGTHLKFSGKKGKSFLNGIGFSLAEKYDQIKRSPGVDVAFSVDINEYNGKKSPQMIIQDIREA